MARVKIALDSAELKAAGVSNDTIVPLEADGRLTLRSWLNLSVAPLGLTYVPSDRGLTVVRKASDNDTLTRPSAAQAKANARVAAALKTSVPFDFHKDPLKKVFAHLAAQTKETFLVDPSALKAGVPTLATTVSGSDSGGALEKALDCASCSGRAHVRRPRRGRRDHEASLILGREGRARPVLASISRPAVRTGPPRLTGFDGPQADDTSREAR